MVLRENARMSSTNIGEYLDNEKNIYKKIIASTLA